MKKRALFLLLIFSSIMLCCNYNQPNTKEKPVKSRTAMEINLSLGRGINIGNTFEADQSWQSPFVAEDLKKIADLGFTHVRVPIRWERADRSIDEVPYTINSDFLKTIQVVVDEALKNKLHVIINMHHHNNLMAEPDSNKARFYTQWDQISEYFKDYPDSLLFEVLNEPHDKLTPELWNKYSKGALGIIRMTNPHRCVLIGTAPWGGLDGLKSLEIPNDEHIILTVHYYNPFHFTHQGASWAEGSDAWLGTKWGDTESERETVANEFQFAIDLAKEKNIPIHIGEFGAYSKADIESRVKWTRYLTRWFEQQGFSWSYWEWNSGFGIYNPKTGEYNQELVDALVNDEMPDL